MKALILDCGGVTCFPRYGHWLFPSNLTEITNRDYPTALSERVYAAHSECAHWLDEGALITSEGREIEMRTGYNRDMNRLLKAGLSDEQCERLAVSVTQDDSRYAFYPDSFGFSKIWSKRYKLAMLSNAMPSLYRALSAQGYARYLCSLTVSCLYGFQKPDERLYLAALNDIHELADECVFVDDLEDNLLTAQRIGMTAVRMKRSTYTIDPVKPFERFSGDCVSDFSELDELLIRKYG